MSTTRLAHLSDIHFDGSAELETGLRALIDAVASIEPDLVVVTGDLSADGRPDQLDVVAEALARLDPIPRIVLPGNRDLEPSVGPPGEATPLPLDADLDEFLALEPAFGFGFDQPIAGPTPDDAAAVFEARFGPLEPVHASEGVHLVAVSSTPRLRSSSIQRAARELRGAAPGALRVFATHHGLLPVPGRKLRSGDLANRSGDVLALLCDLGVDLALHGHIHRAHAWTLGDGRHRLVVASAGALADDGRRDASFLEIAADDGRLEVRRRSVATRRPTVLYSGPRVGGDGSS